MSKESIVFFGCGDVGPVHEPMEGYSALVRPVLASADIRFGQCERVYSERGAEQVHGSSYSRLKPHMASIFSDCGFDVVSMASNHAMDFGAEAMLDTIANLQNRGIQTVGAGRNLQESRQPVIIERNGVRIAILAYCSIIKEGYAAGPNKPGFAPLRVHTYYEPVEFQPGIPPRVVTVPNQGDLENMMEDIALVKGKVHAVILSLHWGLHHIPRMIAEYQPIVAKAAVEAGADLILGGHAHTPKAIEVHRGKTCFYSLSNFIMSVPPLTAEKALHHAQRYGVTVDPDYPLLWYGADGIRSMIAKVVLARNGVQKVSFLPVLIDKQLRPEILCSTDPRFKGAVDFMEWVSEGFNHSFVVEGDEVVVTGRSHVSV